MQELSIRGDGNESDSNLHQLRYLKSESDLPWCDVLTVIV